MAERDRVKVDPVVPVAGAPVPLNYMLSDVALKAVLCTLNQAAKGDGNSDNEKYLEQARRIIRADLDLADGKVDHKISKAPLALRIGRANPYYEKFNATIYNDPAIALDVAPLAEVLTNHALQFTRQHPDAAVCSPPHTPVEIPGDRPTGSLAVG